MVLNYTVPIGTENDSSKRVIKVVSLYETYKNGIVPISEDGDFNLKALEEEIALKYKYFQEESDKYDPEFFRRITLEQVRDITIAKFKSYRDQGMLIQQMGGVLLADELPPIVKADMYGNRLLIMWPWIRKEAPERNLEFSVPKPSKVKLVAPQIES